MHTASGGQISTKHLTTSIKPFFATCRLPQYPEFAKNLRSFDGFNQMSGLWSMFWFKSFRKFFRKNYDFFYFRSVVGNTVDVGGPTIRSGCLPTSAFDTDSSLILEPSGVTIDWWRLSLENRKLSLDWSQGCSQSHWSWGAVMGKHPDLMVAHPTSTIFPTIGRNF